MVVLVVAVVVEVEVVVAAVLVFFSLNYRWCYFQTQGSTIALGVRKHVGGLAL